MNNQYLVDKTFNEEDIINSIIVVFNKIWKIRNIDRDADVESLYKAVHQSTIQLIKMGKLKVEYKLILVRPYMNIEYYIDVQTNKPIDLKECTLFDNGSYCYNSEKENTDINNPENKRYLRVLKNKPFRNKSKDYKNYKDKRIFYVVKVGDERMALPLHSGISKYTDKKLDFYLQKGLPRRKEIKLFSDAEFENAYNKLE